MATVQLNVSGSGEVSDPGQLVDALTAAIAKTAPYVTATVSVSQTATVDATPQASPQVTPS